MLIERGQGTARNDAEAAKWYDRAAEQGFAPAQARLGVLYSEGKGVTLDDTTAYFWLTLATKQNLRAAERRRNQIAQKLTRDEVKKTEVAASAWKPKAAVARNPNTIH